MASDRQSARCGCRIVRFVRFVQGQNAEKLYLVEEVSENGVDNVTVAFKIIIEIFSCFVTDIIR